jgi:hypothetical protein
MLTERVVRTDDDYRDVPVLDMIVQGPDFIQMGWEPVIMRATIDTGAELNLVSYDWLPLLERAGATFVPLTTPTRVSWLNDQTFALMGHLDLRVQVRGTEASRTLRFMVCPRSIDLDMVIGWRDARHAEWNFVGGPSLIDRLALLLVMQRAFWFWSTRRSTRGRRQPELP